MPQVEAPQAREAEEVRCFCGATGPTQAPEDFRGLWLQCDRCRYWQHGSCVGHPTKAPEGSPRHKPCSKNP